MKTTYVVAESLQLLSCLGILQVQAQEKIGPVPAFNETMFAQRSEQNPELGDVMHRAIGFSRSGCVAGRGERSLVALRPSPGLSSISSGSVLELRERERERGSDAQLNTCIHRYLFACASM